jgi:hypothetical protein
MTQIVTKFIQDNAVTGAKIRLANAEMLRARNAANTADINILSVNTSNNVEFQALPYALSSLAIPTAPKQFATIEYINNYIAGKSQAKNSVQYLADSNISGTFTVGSATAGATLVGTNQLVVDGKTFNGSEVNAATPMRVALTGQTSGLQNGIYDLTAGNGSSFTLTRSFDFTTVNSANATSVSTGDYFFVSNGTVYSGYEVLLTTANPITLDTTPLIFATYPTAVSLTAGDMLVKTNNVFSVDLLSLSGLASSNPGAASGQLYVKTDTAVAVKDQTTKLDSATNAVVAKRARKSIFTLASGDITNQYIDLPYVASQDSVDFSVAGSAQQIETVDFSVNFSGGTSGNTRVSFINGLATGGVSALVAGDIVQVTYTSF